jgi:DNA-nicking Smr family endonuclease
MAKLADLKKLVDAARANAPDHHVARPAKAGPPPSASSKAAPSTASVKRALAAARHADGDIDLAQAFADVERLRPRSRIAHQPSRPAPIPRQRIADDADALSASKYGAEPTPHTWEIGQEHEAGQTFVRRGLGSDVLKKLRRGDWSVQAEIDLHGHTIDEAHDALVDFLDEARARGHRCVRVIHGKGLTSPNREPVLKGKVRAWLTRWNEVLACVRSAAARRRRGAVLVLLRGR